MFNISIAIDGTKAAAHGVESCSEASGWLREAGADWDWDWILGLQLGCVDGECSMGKKLIECSVKREKTEMLMQRVGEREVGGRHQNKYGNKT